MKKINSIKVIVIVSIVLSILSCSKSSTNDPKAMIIGTWKEKQGAEDYNGNGKMDDSEIQNLSSTEGSTLIFKLGGNGIGVENSGASIDSFAFTYKVNNRQLILTSSGLSFMTIIDSISSSTLILRDTDSSSPLFWSIFAKQ